MFLMEPERLTLITDEAHPLYDPRVNAPLDESMVLNIMVNGVRVPIIARRNGSAIEVVDGRGRTRAVLEANRRLIAEGNKPHFIRVLTDSGSDADLFGLSISLNEIRREDSPTAKSEKAHRLHNMGYTTQQIAITFGVTRQTVHSWLSLQDLAQPVQDAVEKGEMSATAAAKLANFSRDEQVKRLDDLKQKGKPLTVTTVEKAAKSADNIPAPKMKTRREVEKKLEEILELEDVGQHWNGYIEALKWMLGKETEPVE